MARHGLCVSTQATAIGSVDANSGNDGLKMRPMGGLLLAI